MINLRYIEFNGIPGSGKTTICKSLSSELTKQGVNIEALQDYSFYYSKHKVKRIIDSLFEIAFVKHITLYAFIEIFRNCKFKNVKIQLVTLRNYLLLHRCLRIKKDCILISDQCIIQNVLSCFFDIEISSTCNLSESLETISYSLPMTLSVNVIAEPSVADERMNNRNTREGRLDWLSSEDRIKILEIQKKNLDYLNKTTEGFIHISLCSEKSVDENIKKIIDFIYNGYI